jgi:hypothetical protein
VTLLNFPNYECNNESDVEQKFIFPLLTHPSFLDLPPRSILTKKSLKSFSFVEKSTLPKNYIPDYLISFSGFPVCVVEAKGLDVPVSKALDEARLYAQVLNSQFPHGTNPVLMAMGCNGREMAIGVWDSNQSQTFSVGDMIIGSDTLASIRNLVGVTRLLEHAATLQRSLARSRYVIPARSLSSSVFVDRVEPNSLAPYLNQLYEMFFRSEDPEKTQLILDRAYVDTAELREYDQVLHALLRQIERTHANVYQPIQTDHHREYTLTPELARYDSDITSHGRMHLIIGSRGSGKSLFIARFFTHLFPEFLRDKAVWCTIDFNRAPSSLDNIEDHICSKFIEDAENVGFEVFHLDGLKRIFGRDLSRLQKGALSVVGDEAERNKMTAQELLRLSSDKKNVALRLGSHITGEAARPLIVAFDNVDRRESGQQLKIFQAAQWFRAETRAFALLTLRDVTFERYKNEPPLDAFAQLNNFYIRPPRFSLVLQKRLTLALEEGLKDLQEVEQTTTSGIRFVYSKEHLATFLKNVYSALFGGDQQVGKIVDALAERDVREALGMFARILASGHFNADRIIGIGVGGSKKISDDVLIKILMRSDYRLYSERSGIIHNIFWTPPMEFGGNIFLLSEVLGFLCQEHSAGNDRIVGYWRVEEITSDLIAMGFSDAEIRAATQNALHSKLIAYDGEHTDQLADADLVKITPSGFIHLRGLPPFIEYISSIALHTAIGDSAVASRVAQVWSRVERFPPTLLGQA